MSRARMMPISRRRSAINVDAGESSVACLGQLRVAFIREHSANRRHVTAARIPHREAGSASTISSAAPTGGRCASPVMSAPIR